MNPDTRKLEIAKCINAVAAYFGVSAKALYVSRYSKNKLHLKARVLIWYHLHKSGMSYAEIASEFSLGYDNVQKKHEARIGSPNGRGYDAHKDAPEN